MNIPKSVAIILDGNGRWARSKGMPRNYGHVQGAKNVETICEAAYNMGIKYLTLYAFSTENWNRPSDEVEALMKLLRNYMKTCLQTAAKNNMRVRVIGERSRLDEDIRTRIDELEKATAGYDGLNMTIAINYGARDEITRAVRKLASKVKTGEINPEDISENLISESLDTFDIPDPDLMIRTCGELRLSNFLLWQVSYAELYVTDVAWPDFDEEELKKAVEAYSKRNRKFGNIKNEQ